MASSLALYYNSSDANERSKKASAQALELVHLFNRDPAAAARGIRVHVAEINDIKEELRRRKQTLSDHIRRVVVLVESLGDTTCLYEGLRNIRARLAEILEQCQAHEAPPPSPDNAEGPEPQDIEDMPPL